MHAAFMKAPLVILDRDGVINHDSDEYIKNEDEWVPIPGSLEAICNLSKAGFLVCVATNQSGLARGLFDEYTLARIHSTMCMLVEEAGGKIDGIFFCPHGPDDDCSCRKPRTGLVEQIEEQFSISAEGAWFVGDSEKDLVVAQAKGCKPLLVLTGKGTLTRETANQDTLANTTVFDDLFSASTFIIAQQGMQNEIAE